jgi:hypothetical protein
MKNKNKIKSQKKIEDEVNVPKIHQNFKNSQPHPSSSLIAHVLNMCSSSLDPRGSGLLFFNFMFIRPHPYTCLGIEWSGLLIFHVYKAPPLHLFGN